MCLEAHCGSDPSLKISLSLMEVITTRNNVIHKTFIENTTYCSPHDTTDSRFQAFPWWSLVFGSVTDEDLSYHNSFLFLPQSLTLLYHGIDGSLEGEGGKEEGGTVIRACNYIPLPLVYDTKPTG